MGLDDKRIRNGSENDSGGHREGSNGLSASRTRARAGDSNRASVWNVLVMGEIPVWKNRTPEWGVLEMGEKIFAFFLGIYLG